jgi:hypothetical protein
MSDRAQRHTDTSTKQRRQPKNHMASMLKPGIQRWLQQHCDSSDAVSGGVVILSGSGHGLPDTVAE